MKPFLRRLSLCLLAVVAVEVVLQVGLYVGDRNGRIAYLPVDRTSLSDANRDTLKQFLSSTNTHVEIHRDLGWWPSATRFNSARMRGTRAYRPKPAPGTTRVVTYGDSFTYCTDAEVAESWQAAGPWDSS